VAPWSVAVLAAYAAAGPASYLVLRGRRRRKLRWVVPIGVLAVAVAASLAGERVANQVGSADRVIEVDTLTPGGGTLTNSYRQVLNQAAVPLASDTGASTVFVPPGVTQSKEGGFEIGAHVVGGAGSGEVVRRGAIHALAPSGAPPSTPRTLQTISLGRGTGGLEANLRLTSPSVGVFGVAGRIVGSVSNHGASPVYRLRAQVPSGGQAPLADVVPPGATIAVDVALSAPPPPAYAGGFSRPTSDDDAAMFAAASRSFRHTAQMALVGLSKPTTPARGGGDPSPIRVVVQSMPLAVAQGGIVYSELVTARPVGPAEWVSVVEMKVPTGTVSATLKLLDYGPENGTSSIELFDWDSGQWSPLPRHRPQQTGIDVAMTHGNLDAGIVRVRIRASSGPGGAVMQLELPTAGPAG